MSTTRTLGTLITDQPPVTDRPASSDRRTIDWSAINRDPRFQSLHAKKTRFLWSLMAFSVFFYFLLPIGAAYFTDLFKVKVWGVINFGLLFALSQFIVAWGIAFIYARRASQYDAIAEDIGRSNEVQIGRLGSE